YRPRGRYVGRQAKPLAAYRADGFAVLSKALTKTTSGDYRARWSRVAVPLARRRTVERDRARLPSPAATHFGPVRQVSRVYCRSPGASATLRRKPPLKAPVSADQRRCCGSHACLTLNLIQTKCE